jgi:hypothetical protein
MSVLSAKLSESKPDCITEQKKTGQIKNKFSNEKENFKINKHQYLNP